jgi:hypothetical protein
MRSWVQRFQCRCESNMRSQLCVVICGRPAIQVVGTLPRAACRRRAASSQTDRT